MRPVKVHMPGRPRTEAPPERLVRLIERYRPQAPVIRWGLTADKQGRWALLVGVPAEIDVPVAAVEASGEGLPVVDEAEPAAPITPLAG